MAEMRERAARDTAEFEERLSDLQQQIATDKRNKDFLQLMQACHLIRSATLVVC
jgi:hypothetical protein